MPKIMYCLGLPLNGYDRNGADTLSYSMNRISKEAVWCSRPAPTVYPSEIMAFESFKDAARYSASINYRRAFETAADAREYKAWANRSSGSNYPPFSYLLQEVAAIFSYYVDPTYEGVKQVIELPEMSYSHRVCREAKINYWNIPSQYLLDIVEARVSPNWDTAETQPFFKEAYAEALRNDNESKSSAEKISKLIDTYQNHRWFRMAPRHSQQARAIQTELKTMTQYNLYKKFLAEEKALTKDDQEHHYAHFVKAVRIFLTNPVTYRQLLVSHLPFSLKILNLLLTYAALPLVTSHKPPNVKAEVLNQDGEVEEVLPPSPSSSPVRRR